MASVIRDAWRSVRRAPMHSLAVVSILAFGIAFGTVTFSVVDAVLLKPLPVRNADALTWVYLNNAPSQPRKAMSTAQYFEFYDRATTFEQAGLLSTTTGGSAVVDGIAEFVDVKTVSAGAFDLLGLSAAVGRVWTREDEALGRLDGAVITDSYWTRRFNRDRSALGRTVVVGRRAFQIVGILKASAEAPGFPLTRPPIWIPNTISRSADVSGYFGAMLVRMRPGVTADDVAAEAASILGLDWRPRTVPLAATYTGPVRMWMLLALAASALVVLAACVNAANLLLARSTLRSQEVAIRSSLGASRVRVATSVVVEGLLLAGAAACVALLFSVWSVSAAQRLLVDARLGLERLDAMSLDARVLATAVTASIATGVLFAVVPAWQMSRTSVVNLLKDGGPGATRAGGLWRSSLLVCQVSMVCILVVIAWMFVASLAKITTVDMGLDTEHLLAVKPRFGFGTPIDHVVSIVESTPGVTGVAVSTATSIPLFGAVGGAWHMTDVAREGEDPAPTEFLDYRVSANYFGVAGIRFTQGAGWPTNVDATTNAPVVLDELAARLLFGDVIPVGRFVTTTALPGVHPVVGVVSNVLSRGPEDELRPSVYFPISPSPTRIFASLLVRTSVNPESLVPVITDALEPYKPNQPEPYVLAGGDVLHTVTTRRRFNAWLMSTFGLAGLLIGAAGIFAVMASLVAQQTREIGVRMSLGATPARIQRDVLASAVRHIGLGLAIGLPAAWYASRGFASMLFHVTPTDLSVYLGVAALLSVVALLAAAIPARRAARVDPIESLRA
jgi:predicted permease